MLPRDPFWKELIAEAAQTKSPIALWDEDQRLLGVICRASLLRDLAEVA